MSDLLPSDVNKPGDIIVVVNVPYSGGRCALAHLVSPNPPWVWRVYRAGGGWGEGELPVAALTAALAGGTHLARTYATAEDADADRQAMLAGREHPQRNIPVWLRPLGKGDTQTRIVLSGEQNTEYPGPIAIVLTYSRGELFIEQEAYPDEETLENKHGLRLRLFNCEGSVAVDQGYNDDARRLVEADSERGKHSPHGLDIKFPEEPS